MCKFKTLGVSWPPKGWKNFKEIEASYGQAIIKNPASAVVTGISYDIAPVPIQHKDGRQVFVYAVQIHGWDYNIYNESCEYPVLSFVLKERPQSDAPKYFYMSDIKTQGYQLKITQRSAHRAYMAALFMMKQIAAGQVPEVERILKLYKIHPIQRGTYKIDGERHDSLFCGIVNQPMTDDKNSEAV